MSDVAVSGRRLLGRLKWCNGGRCRSEGGVGGSLEPAATLGEGCRSGTSSGPGESSRRDECRGAVPQRVMQWCAVALVSATGDRRGNVAFEVTLPPLLFCLLISTVDSTRQEWDNAGFFFKTPVPAPPGVQGPPSPARGRLIHKWRRNSQGARSLAPQGLLRHRDFGSSRAGGSRRLSSCSLRASGINLT
jgi:hypothetical protein